MTPHNPQFKIFGHERRALKRELSLLKRRTGSFLAWHGANNDMYEVFGHESPISNDAAEQIQMEAAAEIKRIESLLSETFSLNMV